MDSLAALDAALGVVAFEGTALLAVEGPGRFRYLDISEGVLRMTGLGREQLVGRSFEEGPAPDDLVARLPLWQRAVQTNQPVTYCEPVTVPVGPRVFESTVTPVAGRSGVVTQLVVFARDVTDRERARDQTARAEARYEAMLACSADGFLLVAGDGSVSYESQGCRDLLGLSPAELPELGVLLEHMHPDDVAVATSGWDAATAHPGQVQEFENRYRQPDGTWRHFVVRLVSRLDIPGIESVVATFCDATERTEAEQAEVRARTRLAEILQGASDAIVTIDDAQEIVGFNAAAEEMFGYRTDEILGEQLEVLIPERSRAAHGRFVGRFGRHGPPRRLMSERDELAARHADGSEFPVEITISRAMMADAAYFTAIVRDVSERRAAEAELRAGQRRLAALVRHAPELIAIVDARDRVTYASPGAERLLGYAPDMVEGFDFPVWSIVHPDERERFKGSLAEARARPGSPATFEGLAQRADGTWRRFVATLNDLSDDPALGGVVCNVRDVTQERNVAAQEATLARLGQRVLDGVDASQVIEEAVDAVAAVLEVDLALYAQVDPTGDDLLVRFTGGSIEGLAGALLSRRGTHWREALEVTDRIAYLSGVPTDLDSGTADSGTAGSGTAGSGTAGSGTAGSGTAQLHERGLTIGVTARVAASGEVYGVVGAYWVAGENPRADELEFLHGIANVIASAIERRQYERSLAHQSLHDALTGLPNRVLLGDRLEQALRRSERREGVVAILLVDLDDFKIINETVGHGAGDALLQAVAARFDAAMGPTDTLARVGGDEFVALCEFDAGRSDVAVAVAERLVAALEAPFDVIDDQELFVTASIGIAIGRPSEATASSLLGDADLAMYRAKDRGGDTVVIFNEGLRTRMQARLDVALALRHAVALGELRLFYQPKIDFATGRIVQVEALLRWQHPHDGLLEPAAFLSTAEEMGLIIGIGEWVIKTASAQQAAWLRRYGEHAPVRTFVNLSARQVLHPDLVDVVGSALDATGLDPARLGFEITESVFIDDLDAAADALLRLRALGARLCLDDFGTGYSSLTYLRTLPFDCLKIDKSFVSGLDDDRADDRDATGIVRAVIDLAHDLGLQVTAEGVETAAQAEALALLGCDLAQGYLYAHPKPAEDLERSFGQAAGPERRDASGPGPDLP